MIGKKDYEIGALVGFLTGFFVLLVFYFLEIDFYFKEIILLVLIPILWGLGVWLGGFLGKFFSFFRQFGKFAAVGFLSTSIDFFVLNLMSFFSGIIAGVTLGWINMPGFFIAVTNGYLWNKLWVFNKTDGSLFSDFPKFIVVTFVGLLINSATIILITSKTFFDLDPKILLNIAKMIATVFSMGWNFAGYRLIVFSKQNG